MRALNGGGGEERCGEIVMARESGGRRGRDSAGAASGGMSGDGTLASQLSCSLADPGESPVYGCEEAIFGSLLASIVLRKLLSGVITRSSGTTICSFVSDRVVHCSMGAVSASEHGRKGSVAIRPADLD